MSVPSLGLSVAAAWRCRERSASPPQPSAGSGLLVDLMSDLRNKILSVEEIGKLFDHVTSSKTGTTEQKQLFAAVGRCDKAAMRDVTEMVLRNDHKAARKRMTTCFEEFVRTLAPKKGSREKEANDGFTKVENSKSKKKNEGVEVPKLAADGAHREPQLRGNGGNQPKKKQCELNTRKIDWRARTELD